MTQKKTNRTKFDQGQAIEQFEQYKETGKGSIIKVKENFGGYSSAYAEGWARIFDKKDEPEEEVVMAAPDFVLDQEDTL